MQPKMSGIDRKPTLNQINTIEQTIEPVLKAPTVSNGPIDFLVNQQVTTQNWCAKCSINFKLTSDLVYHMRTNHKREGSSGQDLKAKEEIVKFKGVSEIFKTSALKLSELKLTTSISGLNSTKSCSIESSKEVKKLKCEICSEVFKEKHHLSRHMTSHR
jgi:hypothetical protein